jgi:hypothetical protein
MSDNIMIYVLESSGMTRSLHIPNTLQGLYDAIDCTTLEYIHLDSEIFHGLHAYVDGDGYVNNLEINCMMQDHGTSYLGPILFSRVNESGSEIGVTAMDMHFLDQVSKKTYSVSVK